MNDSVIWFKRMCAVDRDIMIRIQVDLPYMSMSRWQGLKSLNSNLNLLKKTPWDTPRNTNCEWTSTWEKPGHITKLTQIYRAIRERVEGKIHKRRDAERQKEGERERRRTAKQRNRKTVRGSERANEEEEDREKSRTRKVAIQEAVAYTNTSIRENKWMWEKAKQ